MYGILLYLMLPLPILASKNAELMKYLLKDYVPDVRPVCSGQPVSVSIDMGLRQIQEVKICVRSPPKPPMLFSEQKQILSTNVWMRLSWTDCKLTWNVSKYNGIKNIYIAEEKIWIPDISLYENAEYILRGLHEYYRVDINSSGFVKYNFPSQLQTTCNLNIRYFPFDVQICKLSFGSWSYNDLEVTVKNQHDKPGDRSNYLRNGEWELLDYSVQTIATNYSCCKESYSSVVFEIKIQRKPAVYLLNLLFPTIIISAIGLLSFFIPSESGEKISISVTVLLSLAVFQLVISESLPPNSDSLPYLGYFFLANMLFVGFCCTTSITVLNIYHSKAENSTIVRIFRYIKTKGRSMKIADQRNYDISKISAQQIPTTVTQLNDEYPQSNKTQKQQRPQKADVPIHKEFLVTEFLYEMGKSFAEKRKTEQLKTELAIAEKYVNRFFLITAIIIFISLILTLITII